MSRDRYEWKFRRVSFDRHGMIAPLGPPDCAPIGIWDNELECFVLWDLDRKQYVPEVW